MVGCSFKTEFLRVKCPLEALPGEKHCFWHKILDGKKPTESQLQELRECRIEEVYLKKANLIKADLQKVNLENSNLAGGKLDGANLQGAELGWANLLEVSLSWANLQEAGLIGVKLHGVDLTEANLQEVRLSWASLQTTNLSKVKLNGANLNKTRFDSKTILYDAYFYGANLYQSYFDEAKSFRYAVVFSDNVEKEINEVVGDNLDSTLIQLFSNTYVLDLKEIEKKNEIASEIRGKGLVRYVKENDVVLFLNTYKKCLIRNPENKKRNEDDFVKIEGLEDILFENGKIKPKYLYKGDRGSLYEASYDVYNNLYNFYIANGRLDQASHAHYRRGEAHRKLRREKGGVSGLRSVFDYLVLKTLTGYGDRIGRPVLFSGLVIILFAVLFWFFDGIVKNVNGMIVKPDWIDYLYHSITTFTSLGYSNIQPNLTSGHIPQLLVAVESGLGVTMIALIIFVITYQVSR